jgi:hypothetical protein
MTVLLRTIRTYRERWFLTATWPTQARICPQERVCATAGLTAPGSASAGRRGNSTRCGHRRRMTARVISPLRVMTCPPYDATAHRRTAVSLRMSERTRQPPLRSALQCRPDQRRPAEPCRSAPAGARATVSTAASQAACIASVRSPRMHIGCAASEMFHTYEFFAFGAKRPRETSGGVIVASRPRGFDGTADIASHRPGPHPCRWALGRAKVLAVRHAHRQRQGGQ